MEEKIEWTVDYFKKFNERASKLGLPTVIIDEKKMMVYKDEIHKILNIGVKLES